MRISDWSSDVCSSDLSLETADPACARRLAREMSVALDQLAERLQRMAPALKPTPGQLNLVLKELFNSIIRDGDRRRELIGEGFNRLPAGNRQDTMEDKEDEDTWEDRKSTRLNSSHKC